MVSQMENMMRSVFGGACFGHAERSRKGFWRACARTRALVDGAAFLKSRSRGCTTTVDGFPRLSRLDRLSFPFCSVSL